MIAFMLQRRPKHRNSDDMSLFKIILSLTKIMLRTKGRGERRRKSIMLKKLSLMNVEHIRMTNVTYIIICCTFVNI